MPMKKFILVFTFLLGLLNIGTGQTVPNKDWVKSYSSTDSLYDFPTAIDANGNVIVAGYSLTSAHSYDYTVIKYDNNGNQLWVQSYNDAVNGVDQATALEVDNNGNIYVTGMSQTASAGFNYVTIKYDGNGNQKWIASFNGTGNSSDIPSGIAVDPSGNVFVTGVSVGSGTAGDYATVKYNSLGVQQWVNTYNGSATLSNDAAKAITISGNFVYVTGSSQSLLSGFNIVTQKINANNGSQVWATSYNGIANGTDKGNGIVVDASGNVYVTGSTQIAGTNTDYVTIKYTSNGTQSWVSTHDGYGLGDAANAIALDNNNNVVVTGTCLVPGNQMEYHTLQYNNSGVQQWLAIFKTGPRTDGRVNKSIAIDFANDIYICGQLYNGSRYDWAVVRYSPGGNEQWHDVFTSPVVGNCLASDLSVDSQGRIYATGQSFNGTNYDITTIKYDQTPVYAPIDVNNEPTSDAYQFYENLGQVVDNNQHLVPQVKFSNNFTRPSLYFQNTVLSYAFAKIDTIPSTSDTVQRIDMTLVNGNPYAEVYANTEKSNWHNYFKPQCPKGITDVRGFSDLMIPNVYPNIDLHYSSNAEGLKYYFIVKPGGDPKLIALKYSGATSTGISGNKLQIKGILGNINLETPQVYQVNFALNIIPVSWTASWLPAGTDEYRFNTGAYNTALPLVIEVSQGRDVPHPTAFPWNIKWSTYIQGSNGGEGTFGITSDAAGNVYATGETSSFDFPVALGAAFGFLNGPADEFVIKFNNNGSIAHATYFGGSSGDYGWSVAINSTGNVCVLGITESNDMPIQIPTGAYGGSQVFPGTVGSTQALSLTVFDPTLHSLSYSTYFGGSQSEYPSKIKIDATDNIYLCGQTGSPNFPLQILTGAYNQPTVQGTDGFLVKFSKTYSLLWSTPFGGFNADGINDIDIDIAGELILGGYTYSDNTGGSTCLPTTNGDFPLCIGTGGFFQNSKNGAANLGTGFLAKMDPNGVLIWSTFYGGNGGDRINRILADGKNLYITGNAASNGDPTQSGLPTTNGTLPSKSGGPTATNNLLTSGNGDIFLARLDPFAEKVLWSTIYGGPNFDSPRCMSKNIYVGGIEVNAGFPTVFPNSYFYQQPVNPSPVSNPVNYNGFILLANPQNQIIWATYWGGQNAPSSTGTNEGVRGLTNTNVSGNTLFAGGVAFSTDVTYPYFCNSPSYCFDEMFNNTGNLPDAFMVSFDMNLATGINENEELTGGIKVYPNPATDQLNVILNFSGYSTSPKIRIFNDLGQLIYSTEMKGGTQQQIQVNTSSWAKSIYFVEVEVDNHRLHSKFIKQ